MGELIAAGVVSYDTAMDLPLPVLEALYEAKTRVDAQARAGNVSDLSAAIAGALGSEAGSAALAKHLEGLAAVAYGEPASSAGEPSAGYTKEAANPVVISL